MCCTAHTFFLLLHICITLYTSYCLLHFFLIVFSFRFVCCWKKNIHRIFFSPAFAKCADQLYFVQHMRKRSIELTLFALYFIYFVYVCVCAPFFRVPRPFYFTIHISTLHFNTFYIYYIKVHSFCCLLQSDRLIIIYPHMQQTNNERFLFHWY